MQRLFRPIVVVTTCASLALVTQASVAMPAGAGQPTAAPVTPVLSSAHVASASHVSSSRPDVAAVAASASQVPLPQSLRGCQSLDVTYPNGNDAANYLASFEFHAQEAGDSQWQIDAQEAKNFCLVDVSSYTVTDPASASAAVQKATASLAPTPAYTTGNTQLSQDVNLSDVHTKYDYQEGSWKSIATWQWNTLQWAGQYSFSKGTASSLANWTFPIGDDGVGLDFFGNEIAPVPNESGAIFYGRDGLSNSPFDMGSDTIIPFQPSITGSDYVIPSDMFLHLDPLHKDNEYIDYNMDHGIIVTYWQPTWSSGCRKVPVGSLYSHTWSSTKIKSFSIGASASGGSLGFGWGDTNYAWQRGSVNQLRQVVCAKPPLKSTSASSTVGSTASLPSQPATTCVSCNVAGVQSGDGTTLGAVSIDGSGLPISYQFRLVENTTGFPSVATAWVNDVPNGIQATWAVPANLLKAGRSYGYVVDVIVRGANNIQGPSSNWAYFDFQTELPPLKPSVGCQSCNGAGNAVGGVPRLIATTSDPNGDDVRYQFRIEDVTTLPPTGYPLIESGWVTAASGAPAFYDPTSTLQYGHAYAVVVDVLDAQGKQGTSSDFAYFTYEANAAPTTPVVRCSTCSASVQIGSGGIVTATSTDANLDLLDYQFHLVDQITGATIVDSDDVDDVASGASAAWSLPTALLRPGNTYSYTVNVADEHGLAGLTPAAQTFKYRGVVLEGPATTDINTGGVNYLQLAQPQGALVGDLLVAQASVTNDSTVTAPSGWTLLSGWPRTDGTLAYSAKQYVFTHRVASGELGPYKFSTNGPGGYVWASGSLVALAGVSTAPITAAWSQLPSGTSLAATPPTATAGSALLQLTALADGLTTSASVTVPLPMSVVASVANARRGSTVALQLSPSAGSQQPITTTFSQSVQAVTTILQLPAA